MTSARGGAILPISITLNDRTGVTLWAPPWEDHSGEQWEGFLGDGAKILLFPNAAELAVFIASGVDNDLADHPGWSRIQKTTPDALRPGREDSYDLDEVYELAAGDPDPVSVSTLANVIEMVARIADCCEDGALRRLVGSTEEYAELITDDVSYQGKEGRRKWTALGDTIAETWERALVRVETWMSWQGVFDDSTADEEIASVWDDVPAAPIGLVLPDANYLTIRAEIGDDVVFLGTDLIVSVFENSENLARFCRDAESHDLFRLELWEQVQTADVAEFEPDPEDIIDLRDPSEEGAMLLLELAAYCDLQADTSALDDDDIDPVAWNAIVSEIEGCLQKQD
jgi:hypothetical protein